MTNVSLLLLAMAGQDPVNLDLEPPITSEIQCCSTEGVCAKADTWLNCQALIQPVVDDELRDMGLPSGRSMGVFSCSESDRVELFPDDMRTRVLVYQCLSMEDGETVCEVAPVLKCSPLELGERMTVVWPDWVSGFGEVEFSRETPETFGVFDVVITDDVVQFSTEVENKKCSF